MKANLQKKIVKAAYQCDELKIKIIETTEELRNAKEIRMKVFQQEQRISASTDLDGRDIEATHIVAYINEMPVGTTRVRRLYDGSAKIERMAVLREFRQRGIGDQILKYAIDLLRDNHIKIARLSSQERVKGFYQRLGFKEVGDIFDKAGIRHIMMKKDL